MFRSFRYSLRKKYVNMYFSCFLQILSITETNLLRYLILNTYRTSWYFLKGEKIDKKFLTYRIISFLTFSLHFSAFSLFSLLFIIFNWRGYTFTVWPIYVEKTRLKILFINRFQPFFTVTKKFYENVFIFN